MFKNMVDISSDPRTYPIWESCYIRNPNLIALKGCLIDRGLEYVNDLLSPVGDFLGQRIFIDYFDVKYKFCRLLWLTIFVSQEVEPKIFENGKYKTVKPWLFTNNQEK